LTGRSLDEIAADRDRVWAADRDEHAPAAPARSSAARADLAQLPGARKGAMPEAPRPQLATLVDSLPAG
jgi:hypothetical protein